MGEERFAVVRVNERDLVVPAELVPACTTLADEAVRRLLERGDGGLVLACRHVAAGEMPMACAQHPAAGVLCAGCLIEHGDRHDPVVEHTCDACARIVPPSLVSGVAVPVMGTVACRLVSGEVVHPFGGVLVAGLGVCSVCLGAHLPKVTP